MLHHCLRTIHISLGSEFLKFVTETKNLISLEVVVIEFVIGAGFEPYKGQLFKLEVAKRSFYVSLSS